MTGYFSQLLGFAVIFLSLCGFGLFAVQRGKLAVCFAPLWALSCITVLTFFFGLFGHLQKGAYFAAALGIVLLIWGVITAALSFKRGQQSITRHTIMGLLGKCLSIFYIIAGMLLGIVLFAGARYNDMDDFSHWGLIIRTLMETNALPNETTKIAFTNYPPAAAVWNYFFCMLSGYSESRTMLAQFLISLCATAPVFFGIKFKKPLGIAARICLAMGAMCMLNADFYHMRVDVLLGLVGFACVMGVYVYRHNLYRMALCTAPFTVLLVLLKDSGKLFWGYTLIFALFFILQAFKQKRKAAACVAIIGLIVLPLLANGQWGAYQTRAWPNMRYEDNKFAFSPTAISEKFAEKPEQFRKNAPLMYLQNITDLTRTSTKILLLLNTAAVIIYFLCRQKSPGQGRRTVIAMLLCDGALLVYLIGLFFMYYLLMPYGEAQNFAELNRYYTTAILYITLIVGLNMVFALESLWDTSSIPLGKKLSESSNLYAVIGGTVLLACFVVLNSQNFKNYIPTQHPVTYTDADTLQVIEQTTAWLRTQDAPTEDVIIYTGNVAGIEGWDNGFIYWMMRHYYPSAHQYLVASWHTESDPTLLTEPMHAYRIFVVLQQDAAVQNALTQYCTLTNGTVFDGTVYYIESGSDTLHYTLTKVW
ncbi:MAG: hypothetical protein PHG02_07470 [Oscillospiraceae bacterium]|nr:hypothetical protein [Oscillospiraceae bacterium]